MLGLRIPMRVRRQRLPLGLALLLLLLVVLVSVTLHATSMNATAATLSLASRSRAGGRASSKAAAGQANSGQRTAGQAAGQQATAQRRPAGGGLGGQRHSSNRSSGESQLFIPRLLHQNFLGGKSALVREALQPRSHFRRDWWRSCQVVYFSILPLPLPLPLPAPAPPAPSPPLSLLALSPAPAPAPATATATRACWTCAVGAPEPRQHKLPHTHAPPHHLPRPPNADAQPRLDLQALGPCRLRGAAGRAQPRLPADLAAPALAGAAERRHPPLHPPRARRRKRMALAAECSRQAHARTALAALAGWRAGGSVSQPKSGGCWPQVYLDLDTECFRWVAAGGGRSRCRAPVLSATCMGRWAAGQSCRHAVG
jgi:hypothetical protein